MPGASPAIVLASRSPRRVEILTRLLDEVHLTFTSQPADIDESPHAGETPVVYAQRVAAEKALVVALRLRAQNPTRDVLVLGADTTVDLDGRIVGQPADLDGARDMLRQLSGRTHRVHTAVSMVRGDSKVDGIDSALVTMAPITDEMLTWYLGTREWLGKAGAYGAQGEGSALVERIVGSLSTVVGLPVALVLRLSSELGVGWKIDP